MITIATLALLAIIALLLIYLKTNTRTWVVLIRFRDEARSILIEVPIMNGRSYAIRMAEKSYQGWRAIAAWRQYE